MHTLKDNNITYASDASYVINFKMHENKDAISDAFNGGLLIINL